MQLEKLDTTTLDDLYQMLYDTVKQSIAEKWSEAIVTAEITDEQSGLTYGRYRKEQGDPSLLCFPTDYNTYLICDTIRSKMSEQGAIPWQKTVIQFSPDALQSARFSNDTSAP
jgi:hypothetical protein